MPVENRPFTFINNAITRIKEYRPPPLRIILNGPPKDGLSNVERTAIAVIGIGLVGLLHNPGFYVIPAIYALEMMRQAILSLKK